MGAPLGQVNRLLRILRSGYGRLAPARWSGALRWRKLPHVLPLLGLVAVLVSGLTVIVLLPPLFSPELDDPQAQFEVRDRARLTVAAIIGGVVVLVGAYVNWRRVSALERQVTNAQLGQITERFTRAIDQLGAVRSDNAPASEIRAGGVRSLERIARESDADFWPIVDILVSYLRSVSPAPPPDVDPLDGFEDRAYEIRNRMDVAFTVEAIGRLWPGGAETIPAPLNLAYTFVPGIALSERRLERANLRGANLRQAELRSARLTGADLRHADLARADLGDADLRGADLRGACLEDVSLVGSTLMGATLNGADLTGADLNGVDLTSAHLTDANLAAAALWGADLTGAGLRRADLVGADLSSADLSGANLREADLREASLRGAILARVGHDADTRWPEGFNPPPGGDEVSTGSTRNSSPPCAISGAEQGEDRTTTGAH